MRFIGGAAHGGSAGEVRFDIRGDQTTIFIDTNGDSAADREIVLTGAVELRGGDFILRADALPMADGLTA